MRRTSSPFKAVPETVDLAFPYALRERPFFSAAATLAFDTAVLEPSLVLTFMATLLVFRWLKRQAEVIRCPLQDDAMVADSPSGDWISPHVQTLQSCNSYGVSQSSEAMYSRKRRAYTSRISMLPPSSSGEHIS